MPSIHGLLIDLLRLTIWLVVLAVIFVPIEWLFSRIPHTRSRRSTLEDLGLYFFNGLVPALILALPAAALAAVAQRIPPAAYVDWLDGLPLWLLLVMTFIVGEVGFYWGHRWSHQVPLLWQFHVVHHRPAGLHWLVNTRAHPVDIVFGRICGLVPIYMFGLSGRGAGSDNLPAILFTLAGVVWGFFIHANVRWRLGWLSSLLATPHFHHWHHTKSGPIDRNYASMLPVMDRVFGTLHAPRHEWPKDYGVKD